MRIAAARQMAVAVSAHLLSGGRCFCSFAQWWSLFLLICSVAVAVVFQLSKAWLRGDYQEQNIPINDEVRVGPSPKPALQLYSAILNLSLSMLVLSALHHESIKDLARLVQIYPSNLNK